MTGLVSRAEVRTSKPERYAEQLVAHLGRKIELRFGARDGLSVSWTRTTPGSAPAVPATPRVGAPPPA